MLKKEITLESVVYIRQSDEHFVQLGRLLDTMHGKTPISLFRFKLQAGSTKVFNYRIDLMDTRSWIQIVDFTSDVNDPIMTFNVPNGWRLSEFANQREIRDILVLMHQKYTLSNCECKWS